LAVTLLAQQAPRGFDVSSIKPSPPGNTRPPLVGYPAGRLTTVNASLLFVIRFAYDLRDDQILNAPGWLASTLYDIEAKASNDVPFQSGPEGARQIRLMTQVLLAQRFKFAAHQETRQEPVYRLTIAKGGAKVKATEDKPGPITSRPGRLTGESVTIPVLIKLLTGPAGRPIIDETGLTARYNFELKYGPEMTPGGVAVGPDAPPSDPNAPSIFTAVREQLGLRLDPSRGPVEVLVIEHVERPSEN
jgi:uncharacterized protein (TIGR03435 family)